MKPLELLAIASLAFTAVKLVFSIIQWVAEKDGDRILRKNLDSLYDELDQLSLAQLSTKILSRISSKLDVAILAPGKGPRLKLVLVFLLLNILAYVIGQGIFCSIRNECGNTLGHDSVLKEDGPLRLSYWFALSFTGSIVIQFACLFLVYRLLRRAKTGRNSLDQLALLLLCAALLIITFLSQYAVQQLATYFAFGQGPYWDKLLSNILNVKPYFIATLVLSMAAGFPLLLFLLVLLISLILRALPNAVRLGLIWVIWKVTTDSTPVLERLGYVAGGIASASSAIAAYIKA